MLEQVKLLKGISDNTQDELIELIIEDSKARILSYINAYRVDKLPEVPSAIEYILRDVSVMRFNKLNSEGASEDSEEGRTFKWKAGYLTEYEDILARYFDPLEDLSKPGYLRVIF
ncbi:phage head-tail connector protein [Aerococcus urinaeequi]